MFNLCFIRGSTASFRLKLCRAWLTDTVPTPPIFWIAPAEPLDLWLLTERLLRDWRTLLLDVELRRYALNPEHQDDLEAGLREQALALADRLARGTTATSALAEALRARQFGRESRANKGINLLPEDSGPGLNLPPHIAQEFLRARTARPPAAFADRTENYFQKLFHDLKR